MSDYTPTTDEMRSAWMLWRRPFLERHHWFPDSDAVSEAIDPEFNRWLAAVKAEAWDAAVSSMRYEDGTPVELIANQNPYRKENPDE